MTPRPPRSTLLPYTTLVRSQTRRGGPQNGGGEAGGFPPQPGAARPLPQVWISRHRDQESLRLLRSEEHTSELQSRQYLVCRLLLENKPRSHRSRSRAGLFLV